MNYATTSVIYQRDGQHTHICYRDHTLSPLDALELLVEVKAAALNHADVMQRDGTYHPPSHETKVPGIEVAGRIIAVGSMVSTYQVGDKVCGVVPGGGFSRVCKMDSLMAMPVPTDWSFEEAAAFAEAALTANEALVTLGALRPGQVVVIHAASGGIGTMLMRMAQCLDGIVIATTSRSSKVETLRELGAAHVIDEQGINFYRQVHIFTGGTGADLVIDFLGGRYIESNLRALKLGGTLVSAGALDGPSANLNLEMLINKRITVSPLTLRMKPADERQAVMHRFLARWWQKPLVESLRPLVHAVFPFLGLEAAQAVMVSGEHIGKLVISLD